MNEPIQDISIETPQTLREVGIHLGNLSKSIEELKTLQIKQHAENIARMNELQENSPNRKEFDELRSRVDDKADKWVELALKLIFGAIGLSIIGAIMAKILIK